MSLVLLMIASRYRALRVGEHRVQAGQVAHARVPVGEVGADYGTGPQQTPVHTPRGRVCERHTMTMSKPARARTADRSSRPVTDHTDAQVRMDSGDLMSIVAVVG